jgi:small subunit ribosomal protein S18
MIRSKQTNNSLSTSYASKIDYKDVDLLKIFVTEQGKILPRRATGITVQQQRRLAKAVKRARILALLPFVTSNQNP